MDRLQTHRSIKYFITISARWKNTFWNSIKIRKIDLYNNSRIKNQIRPCTTVPVQVDIDRERINRFVQRRVSLAWAAGPTTPHHTTSDNTTNNKDWSHEMNLQCRTPRSWRGCRRRSGRWSTMANGAWTQPRIAKTTTTDTWRQVRARTTPNTSTRGRTCCCTGTNRDLSYSESTTLVSSPRGTTSTRTTRTTYAVITKRAGPGSSGADSLGTKGGGTGSGCSRIGSSACW